MARIRSKPEGAAGEPTWHPSPSPPPAPAAAARRFERGAWLVLAFASALVLLSVAQKAYRLTLPTEGWSSTTNFETDAPLLVENLLGEPSNADLRPDDLVVAVEGMPFDDLLGQVLRGESPAISYGVGDTVRYTVQRDGEEVDVDVLLFPGSRIGLAGVLRDLFVTNWIHALRGGLMILLVAFLFWKRPDNLTARLLFLMLAATLASTISWAVTPLGVAATLRPGTLGLALFFSHLIHALIEQPLSLHVILSFPRPSPLLRRRWSLPVLYGLPVAVLAAELLFPDAPFISLFLVVALYNLLGIALVVRMVLARREAVETAQVRWFGFGYAIYNLGLVFFGLSVVGLVPQAWVELIDLVPSDILFMACIVIAILRYRLFDIDVVLNRTLVYGGLSVGVVALYTLVVVGLGRLLPAQDGLGLPLVATGLIAVAFNPVRVRLQRGVNRLLYGERDDPYAVLRMLAHEIEVTTEPSKLLPAITETVAQVLRLPFASVTLMQGTESELVAQVGQQTGEVITWPLTHQGEVIGEMNLQPRAGETFRPAELSLQKTIAQQASLAAYALRQSLALQRSLEALVTTREEERLRIRRDLHDGLGPTLAGITMKLDAARNHLANRPEEAAALLQELKRQTQQAIGDIRRLVYDLRPPALDQLGLAGALREQVSTVAGDLDVALRLPPALGTLPPAVEVALYRIVQEALTNVRRHAKATACRIVVELGDAVTLTVEDDGVGMPAEYRAGVGLRSMRERAEELGGTFWAGASEMGGTRVAAGLPLSAS